MQSTAINIIIISEINMFLIYYIRILIPWPTLTFSWNFLNFSVRVNIAAAFYRGRKGIFLQEEWRQS